MIVQCVRVLVLCWIGMSGLYGCSSILKGEGSPATRYYLLSSMNKGAAGDTAFHREIRLAMEPVELPDYLSRLQIVHRLGDHRLAFGETDLWGEDLDSGLTRVMVENFSRLMNSNNVWRLPMKNPVQPDFRLRVQFIRFEVDSDGRALLSARWTLQGQGAYKDQTFGTISEIHGGSIGTQNTDAQVAALSAVLETFCREIAANIPNQGRS
ncbi:MAG: membrane integrity-associated transporter subunit PqiC [Magnetococcales bacterium]|nr:membrane integrity-associated transporter subunit PqiC [Magnetococcales bacterium]